MDSYSKSAHLETLKSIWQIFKLYMEDKQTASFLLKDAHFYYLLHYDYDD